MFKYFPTNYPWNRPVDLAIETGARIGRSGNCARRSRKWSASLTPPAPARSARLPVVLGPGRHKMGSNWFRYLDSPPGCHIQYDAGMDIHAEQWKARAIPVSADASQLSLYERHGAGAA